MDLHDDFDFLHGDAHHHHTNGTIEDDFPLFHHSTPSLSRSHPPAQARAIDYPSLKRHYGLVTFADYQLPILYRLIHDSLYIPYIRFSYVLHLFEHSSYKKFFVNVRNLPVVEMTATERAYYDQIASFPLDSDWSNSQLLSVSVLDGVLAIINLTEHFHAHIERTTEWQAAMSRVRRDAHDRWILDERVILARLAETETADSACISSTTIAQRRALFEQRFDLSIVDDAGGFVQIESFIYPFVKNPANHQIYINLDDIRQICVPLPSCLVSYANQSSALSRAYSIVAEQAQSNLQWNSIQHGRNNDLAKYLPQSASASEQQAFLPLQTFLHLFFDKQSNLQVQFVQLFETASLDEIESAYKDNIARQFVLMNKRRGGLMNKGVPCLVSSEVDRSIVSIPSESRTRRVMSNDERLYLNMILLYNGLWKNLLSKGKQWYWKELDGNDKENVQVELFGAR